MSTVRVVISTTRVFSEALGKEIASHAELSVVDQVDDQPALFAALRRELIRHMQSPDDVVAAITSTGSRQAADILCTRLLEEFPDVIVYAVHERGTTRFRTYIEIQEIPASLDALLTDLRSFSVGEPTIDKIVPYRPEELDID